MRVLLTTFASTSHAFPMVPLAWALCAAGHEVRVACGPGVADAVTSAGLTAAVVDDTVDTRAIWAGGAAPAGGTDWRDGERERAARALDMFVAAADAATTPLLDLARRWSPRLIVFEPRAYAGPVVGELLGVPAVRHLYGVDYTLRRAPEEWPALARLWERHGLARPEPHGVASVDPCPPRLQVSGVPARIGVRYVPYNGPATEPWPPTPRAARPRVCVTWGTSFARYAGHLATAAAAVAGIAALGVDVTVAVAPGQRELLGGLPAGADVVEGLALHLLLPHCDAVVHQGGAGTTMTAAACGVPQLVVPALGDRYLNAERVAAAGAGLSVPEQEAEPAALGAAALRLLRDPSLRTGARRLRNEITRQPPPSAAVAALVQLAEARTVGARP
jgi:UDP:flavonoid glycosyltransferase YjiC (YdhE family)